MTSPSRTLACIAAVNDADVLRANLCASPMVSGGRAELLVRRGYPSAARAYNAGLEGCRADVVVLAHQDVYLPLGWDARVEAAIDGLESGGVPWGVLGLFGVTPAGEHVGRVWSSGLDGEVRGRPLKAPEPAVSVDEMVIVLNNKVGLRFDDDLPAFHLYGTDIVQTSIAAGFGAFVIEAPAVHNSVPVLRLDAGYRRAYRYLQRKWRDRLPVPTCVVPVTRFGWPLMRFNLRTPKRRLVRMLRPRSRHPSPGMLAQSLGYEVSA